MSKSRDYNIRKNYSREINLSTKVVKSKKVYSRTKYKKTINNFGIL
jgi:hypothetical protein